MVRDHTGNLAGRKHASRSRQLGKSFALAIALLSTTSATATSQAGTATFDGGTNGVPPTVSYNGPMLSFTSRVAAGFGDQATVGTLGALWWDAPQYSGQGMVYGSTQTTGHVLELRFEADAGFELSLVGSLFGGWANASRYVSYQLFSDDFLQSTSLATVLTGTMTPATALFNESGWGNAIRLQFTQTDPNGVPVGLGANVVGIQDIDYVLRDAQDPPDVIVPEPGTLALVATGLAIVGYGAQRRRILRT